MSNESHVIELHATGEEVGKIIQKIASVVQDDEPSTCLMALLSSAMMVMYPQVTDDQLLQSVHELSQQMCLMIDGFLPSDTKIILN